MTTNGQATLRKAATYLGGSEGLPNRSGAAVIDLSAEMYGLAGVPWCGTFVGWCVAESEASAKYRASAKTIASPSTQVTADKARARGWLLPGNGKARPGDWFILPGVHVGFVNSVGPGNTFTTIEGNHKNGIASVVRSWSDGWQRISLPDVGDAGAPTIVSGYGFDDTRVRLFGGWPQPEPRAREMARYADAHPDQWTQAVRVAQSSPYAFRAGPSGTFAAWTFGPWIGPDGKAARDNALKMWEDSHKATARPWKKKCKEA